MIGELDIYSATMIAEGVEEVETEEELLDAWDLLLRTGVCWQLQGRFGRTARDLAEDGLIGPGSEARARFEEGA